MNLYIPEIGDTIVLSKDWHFDLHSERRNNALIQKLGHPASRWSEDIVYPTIMPTGTVLKVDRIYIRKGISEYSSITFYATIGKNKIRFWAKLSDCNKIEFTKGDTEVKVKIVFQSWIPENRGSINRSTLEWMKNTGREGLDVIEHEDGTVTVKQYGFRVISARKHEKVLGLESTFKIKVETREYSGKGFIGKRTYDISSIENVKHVLKDLEGNVIAESASIATIKKKAKEHVKNTL